MFTNKEVRQAENIRLAIKDTSSLKTIATLRDRIMLPPDQLNSIPGDQIPNFMRVSRIVANDFQAISQLTTNGRKSWEWLRDSRDIARRIFYNENVWSAATLMHHDPEGNIYHMAPEMCRDCGRHHQKVNGLTPSRKVLRAAADDFAEAIGLSPLKSSVSGVARMEWMSTKRMLGKRIDFEDFTDAFHIVTKLEVNNDRVAAVSWALVMESLIALDTRHLRIGLAQLQETTRSMKIDWKKNYLAKEIIKRSFGVLRRMSAPKLAESEAVIK